MNEKMSDDLLDKVEYAPTPIKQTRPTMTAEEALAYIANARLTISWEPGNVGRYVALVGDETTTTKCGSCRTLHENLIAALCAHKAASASLKASGR